MQTQLKTLSVRDALDDFTLDRQAQNHSATTIRNYCRGILTILPENISLAEVTSSTIKEKLTTLPVSPTSKRTYLAYVKAFLSFCVSEGFITSNPASDIKPPKTTKKVLDALTEEEVTAILGSDLDVRERALFSLLLDTGIRIHEAARLKRGQFGRSGGTIILGKGNKERFIQLSPTTLKTLRQYERTHNEAHLWHGREGALSVRSLRLILEEVGERLGIDLSPHKIRRTTTILMLRQGVDLHSLAAVLGHSDITVLRQYLPFTQSDVKRAFQHSPLSPQAKM